VWKRRQTKKKALLKVYRERVVVATFRKNLERGRKSHWGGRYGKRKEKGRKGAGRLHQS